MNRDLLGELAPRAPRRLLEDLATISQALAQRDRPRPEIELLLVGGQLVRGRLVDVGDDRDHAIAIVATGDLAATFVRVDQIAAINLGDASVLVRGVTAETPVPSRLELARQLAARRDSLAGALGRAIAIEAAPVDDEARRTIGLALPLACDVLAAIAGDAMGRQALAPIATLELVTGTSPEVWRDGGKLVIQLSPLVTESFAPASLRTAIERVL